MSKHDRHHICTDCNEPFDCYDPECYQPTNYECDDCFYRRTEDELDDENVDVEIKIESPEDDIDF